MWYFVSKRNEYYHETIMIISYYLLSTYYTAVISYMVFFSFKFLERAQCQVTQSRGRAGIQTEVAQLKGQDLLITMLGYLS